MLEKTSEEVSSDEEPCQTESKRAATPEWIDIGQYDDTEVEEYLASYGYKMTCSHGKQKSNCSIHPDRHLHRQEYGYLRCTSMKCVQTEGDACHYTIKVSIAFNQVRIAYNILRIHIIK